MGASGRAVRRRPHRAAPQDQAGQDRAGQDQIGGRIPMRLLRRHGVWLLVATLMGSAGAVLATSGQKAQYTSAAQVDVEARVFASTVPVTPNLATEEQVARSGLVTASAAPKLGMTTTALISHL